MRTPRYLWFVSHSYIVRNSVRTLRRATLYPTELRMHPWRLACGGSAGNGFSAPNSRTAAPPPAEHRTAGTMRDAPSANYLYLLHRSVKTVAVIHAVKVPGFRLQLLAGIGMTAGWQGLRPPAASLPCARRSSVRQTTSDGPAQSPAACRSRCRAGSRHAPGFRRLRPRP